jgi:hypothetical protein
MVNNTFTPLKTVDLFFLHHNYYHSTMFKCGCGFGCKLYHFPPHQALAPETLEAEPSSTWHPNGKYNSVLVNIDPMYNWPKSGISSEISAVYVGVKH